MNCVQNCVFGVYVLGNYLIGKISALCMDIFRFAGLKILVNYDTYAIMEAKYNSTAVTSNLHTYNYNVVMMCWVMQ